MIPPHIEQLAKQKAIQDKCKIQVYSQKQGYLITLENLIPEQYSEEVRKSLKLIAVYDRSGIRIEEITDAKESNTD